MSDNYGHELDFARGYIFIMPFDFKTKEHNPHIIFSEDCPEDIKERVLNIWPSIVEETERRHREGIYSSLDYF